MGRGTRLACDSRVLPVNRSKASDGLLLVRPVQSLAPDLKIEESNPELGQTDTIARPCEVGKSSRGDKTRPPWTLRTCSDEVDAQGLRTRVCPFSYERRSRSHALRLLKSRGTLYSALN
jgi:hypothetical protein